MVLYRLEKRHENIHGTNIGRGVYIGSGLQDNLKLDSMFTAHNNNDTHPSLRNDLPIYDYTPTDICRGYYCACPTIKKLEKWFDGYLDEILEQNFVIVKYVVNEMIIGVSKKQCFFENKHIISKEIVLERNKLEIVAE